MWGTNNHDCTIVNRIGENDPLCLRVWREENSEKFEQQADSWTKEHPWTWAINLLETSSPFVHLRHTTYISVIPFSFGKTSLIITPVQKNTNLSRPINSDTTCFERHQKGYMLIPQLIRVGQRMCMNPTSGEDTKPPLMSLAREPIWGEVQVLSKRFKNNSSGLKTKEVVGDFRKET